MFITTYGLWFFIYPLCDAVEELYSILFLKLFSFKHMEEVSLKSWVYAFD